MVRNRGVTGCWTAYRLAAAGLSLAAAGLSLAAPGLSLAAPGLSLAAPGYTPAAPGYTLAAPAPYAGFNAVGNSTGLPAYPNLTDPVMDPVARTDTLGRWCTHFSAITADSLDSVEAWYRNILARASETELIHDRRYANFTTLAGIKLALGIDYVAVYRVNGQAPTRIDLYRCSPVI